MVKISSGFSAETVLQQLGGRKFIAMTGAHSFSREKNSIMFKIPRASNSIKHVKIILTPDDLYDIEFRALGSKTSLAPKIVKTVRGVYFDQLQKVFTEQTGLYTHL